MYQYHAAEAARQMGMPDTARYHYRQIIDSMKIEFYSINRPHYLFAALAYARLARNKELRQLLKMAKEKLNNDPWLYFNHAFTFCIDQYT